jgi:hypothetical protein
MLKNKVVQRAFNATQVAAQAGVTTKTLLEWRRKGAFPEPDIVTSTLWTQTLLDKFYSGQWRPPKEPEAIAR